MSVQELSAELEYADECLDHLMDTESLRQQFHARSPQMAFRDQLLQRIRVLCLCHRLSTRVRYLSIYIMDFFMDNHIVDDQSLELLLLCSLSIAVKVEECDRIVKYSQMFSESNQYTADELIQMEATILRYFDWQFLTPTAATYIDYFCAKCLPEVNSKRYINRDIVDKYLDKSLDIRFYRFSPSVIAASAIYYTRFKHNLEPFWPKSAQKVTKYSLKELNDCITELYDFLTTPSMRFISLRNQLNDSGFIDDNTDESLQ